MKSNKLVRVIFIALLTMTVILSGMAIAGTQTQHEYVVSLIKSAGMKDAMLGTPDDCNSLAQNLGFFDNWDYDPAGIVTDQVKASMDIAMAGAFGGLQDALSKKPMEPYFVNGMAQPIFYYGNNHYNDTSGEGAIRFVVYVESDLDTDNDGKLDLVKTLVQLPRAALDGAKFSTVFEARPYIEGTNGQSVAAAIQTAGNEYLAANPGLKHEDLFKTATPRLRAGEATLEDMVANAHHTDWYYRYSGGSSSASISPGTGTNETQYEDLNWYDYFLVRGFAVVQSAGIGSAGSEGFATCGADVEVNAFRCIIEWLTGDRKAYTDLVSNIEIKADWSNGNVGMTGRSYAGTTQFGLATSGVKGLKTVVPVAGIASWYEYTNSQGVANSIPYIVGLAWHVNSRLASPTWSTIYNRYAGYSQLMRQQETALVGDYGQHWAFRDYTVENWFRDWGPSKIQIPILLVHGANDDNVRPKQSVLMYESAKKAGVDVKLIWHQGHHMTPTFPAASPNATDAARPYSMMCGAYTYDEWLNLWFSNYLYGIDNGIKDLLPGVLSQNNVTGEWVSYDSWNSANTIVLNNAHRVKTSPSFQAMAISKAVRETPIDFSVDFPLLDHTPLDAYKNKAAADEGIIMPAPAVTRSVFTAAAAEDLTVINSANVNNQWQNFLDAPTAGSTVYHLELPDDVTVKGVTRVNIRAAISSVGVSLDEPLRMHAKLVEVAAPGTTLKYFGSNSMGSTINVTIDVASKDGGSWQGGGITSHNIARFIQATTGTYREIAKGWMDLSNPKADYYSYTADRANRIVAKDSIGVFNDYSLYLQPAIHTATKGNKLALIITTGGTNAAGYTGGNAFTFTIDNDATNVVIPVAANVAPVITLDAPLASPITVTEGKITESLTIAASATMGATLNYQWFSNTTDSTVGGTPISGANGANFPIPTTLKPGTYYYYCEVSAAGADPILSNVVKVTVKSDSGTGGDCIDCIKDVLEDICENGCNTGVPMLAIVALAWFALRRKP
ncbi:MAG: hypothetical protein FWF87_01870 [Synergistaceae bacterium]|nr:hypothetical protein [Synergistaceae bacterium]